MNIVQRLIYKHGTNNPLKIAGFVGINVCFEDLGNNIWGYYTKLFRIPQIHINNRLGEVETVFAAGHELGHHYIHPNINTPFLKRSTLYSVQKIEREANHFAIRLMIGVDIPAPGESAESFLYRCGIPKKFHEFY